MGAWLGQLARDEVASAAIHLAARGVKQVGMLDFFNKNIKEAEQYAMRVCAHEIAEYLRKGYLLRMRGEVSGQVNLISPAEIKREVF
jgi:hypothetical protein